MSTVISSPSERPDRPNLMAQLAPAAAQRDPLSGGIGGQGLKTTSDPFDLEQKRTQAIEWINWGKHANR